jgi:hypothetical protein
MLNTRPIIGLWNFRKPATLVVPSVPELAAVVPEEQLEVAEEVSTVPEEIAVVPEESGSEKSYASPRTTQADFPASRTSTTSNTDLTTPAHPQP